MTGENSWVLEVLPPSEAEKHTVQLVRMGGQSRSDGVWVTIGGLRVIGFKVDKKTGMIEVFRLTNSEEEVRNDRTPVRTEPDYARTLAGNRRVVIEDTSSACVTKRARIVEM